MTESRSLHLLKSKMSLNIKIFWPISGSVAE